MGKIVQILPIKNLDGISLGNNSLPVCRRSRINAGHREKSGRDAIVSSHFEKGCMTVTATVSSPDSLKSYGISNHGFSKDRGRANDSLC